MIQIKRSQAFGSSFFLGKSFFGDEGCQNMFVYQPTFSILGLKEDKSNEKIIFGNWKGYLNLNLKSKTVTWCLLALCKTIWIQNRNTVQ